MKKLNIVILLAIGVTVGLVMYNQFTREFLEESAHTLNIIKDIEKEEFRLEREILKSSFYLYYNYDQLENSIKKIKKV
ncbi:MAG: hypothetical protein Q9M89_01385 [Persephonella sp.]|nr:hypothetical protein [Persephonella sp.]